MRVCFFIPDLSGGGAQRQCIALLNELQSYPEVEAHLILLGRGVHDDALNTAALQIHRIEVRNFASPIALAFVIRSLRRVRPDILVSWLHPADIWAYVATRFVRRVPWVITERNSAYSEALVYAIRMRLGSHSAAAIVANSHAGKQLWELQTPRAEVRVIPNMVIDDDVVSTVGVDRKNSVRCLSVGRLDPEKNVIAMSTAFAQFATAQPQASLVIAGIGALASDVKTIAEAAGLANRVEFLGFRKDVPHLMASARLLLSFSRNEGMPNVVMEAVAAGLPAVVSDIPEHRALLGDDYPYYVQPDSSAGQAADVIAWAWETGADEVEQNYSYARELLATMTPEKVAREYLAIFAEVTARAAARKGRSPSAGWFRWRR